MTILVLLIFAFRNVNFKNLFAFVHNHWLIITIISFIITLLYLLIFSDLIERISIRLENRSLYAKARKGTFLDEVYDENQIKYRLYGTKERCYFIEFSKEKPKNTENITYSYIFPREDINERGYIKVYEIHDKPYSLWAPEKMPKKDWWKDSWAVCANDTVFFVSNFAIMEKFMRWKNKSEYTVLDNDIDNFVQNEFFWDSIENNSNERRILEVHNFGMREYDIYYLDEKLFTRKKERFSEGIPVKYDESCDESKISIIISDALNINENDYEKVYEHVRHNELSYLLLRHKKDEKDWLFCLVSNGKDCRFYKIDIDVAYHEIYGYYKSEYRQKSHDYVIHNETIYNEIIKCTQNTTY